MLCHFNTLTKHSDGWYLDAVPMKFRISNRSVTLYAVLRTTVLDHDQKTSKYKEAVKFLLDSKVWVSLFYRRSKATLISMPSPQKHMSSCLTRKTLRFKRAVGKKPSRSTEGYSEPWSHSDLTCLGYFMQKGLRGMRLASDMAWTYGRKQGCGVCLSGLYGEWACHVAG